MRRLPKDRQLDWALASRPMACGAEAKAPNLNKRCNHCAAMKATSACSDVHVCEWRWPMLNVTKAKKAAVSRSKVLLLVFFMVALLINLQCFRDGCDCHDHSCDDQNEEEKIK
jgi:hypothetical protein